MNTWQLALAQVASQPARALHLVAALSVAIAAWLGLTALAASLERPDTPNAAIVQVQNSRSNATLPLRYATRIQQMRQVSEVSYMRYLPVVCQAPSSVAMLNGWGGAGVQSRLARTGIPDPLQQQWMQDSLGILVGATLASNCGWKTGMTIEPKDFAGQPMELHIVGVFRSTEAFAEQIAIAHFDYLNRLAGPYDADQVVAIQVLAKDAQGAPTLAADIDAAFIYDDPPTESTSSSVAENSLARFGQLNTLIGGLLVATLLSAALVFVSALAHSVAERRKTSALLRALGFRRRFIFSLFACECAVLVVAGLAVGAAVGTAAIGVVSPAVTQVTGQFLPPNWAWSCIPAIGIVLLLMSLAWPAWVVARVRAGDCRLA
jgi:ABC-type lipoprotein release transport system permease subunit